MADLALGYSKTALDFVVNKVQSAIKEEEEQWQTVQRDLVFITGEFEMMQSFLNTVDGERLKSLVVRTWVQQVRDLSYDVEDSIEFVLHLDFGGKRPWWLRLLPSWMKAAPEAPVDEAVAEITQLKARVVDVSSRNMRYNLVTGPGAKPGQFHVLGGSHININDVPDLREVFEYSDKSLQVVCVLSETVGDLEALLFIRQIYEKFTRDFSRRAWVKLMHPFNPHEFIRSLLAQFLRSSCEAEGKKILGLEVLTKMEEIQLIKEFKHEVNTHDYLIVLEGVSSMEEWDAIKTYLPDRMNKSRIVVWTHHAEIATLLCTGVPYRAFALRQSSPADHPSYVFYREARVSEDHEEQAGAWPQRELVFQALRWCDNRRIALWGPPGVGKTALMRAVYDQLQGLGEFDGGFGQQVWADVPDPFVDADHLARNILSGLTKETWYRRGLVTTCQFILEHRVGRTLLVVLDGVRSKEDWDRINADLLTCAMPEIGNCVVVITHDESVAKHIAAGEKCEMFEIYPPTADSEARNDDGCRVETGDLLKVVMDKNSRRIAVWGPPGVGKTALVRAVYNVFRQQMGRAKRDEGFRHQVWANVPDPLVDVVCVSRDIISGIMKYDDDTLKAHVLHMINDDVIASRFLLEHSPPDRTLVVLDSVRSKEDWDQINANVTWAIQPGSCVIVITEDESVAAHCVERSDDHMLRVNRLGAAAALRLFLEKVHIRSNDVIEECRSLSSKCGGLPKCIVDIAQYLAEKHQPGAQIRETRLLNDNLIRQLQSKQGFDCFKYLLTWLHSKFDGSPQLLKKCIFYVSLFPWDSNIRRKRLVRRWIAEGYCSANSKEEAENLIGKVGDLCLFQTWETVIPVPSAMSKTSCQVNSSFLDYIITRQTEEKTFLPLEISVLEGRCSLPTNRVGQHLAIGSSWGRDEAAYISLDFSRLRSLTVSGDWKPFFILQKMRVLRVLDLEGTCNLEDGGLDKIGELMPRLKFLSLRRCTPISRLPNCLGTLMLLETLDIRHTSITVLPKKITKLQKLQHIRAGTTQWGDRSGPDVPVPAAAPTLAGVNSAETPTEPSTHSQPRQSTGSRFSACLSKSPGGSVAGYCTGGVGVPRGMGGMKALHTLGVVDVDMPGGKALLAELMKKRTESPLRKLSLCGLHWYRHLLHCISRQDQLESLSLRAEKLQVEHFNLPPNLLKLSLDVAGILYQHVVDAIKDHEKLQTLRLHAKEVEGCTVRFFAAKAEESVGGSFSEVNILEISCSSSLHVMFSPQGMQKLELLKDIWAGAVGRRRRYLGWRSWARSSKSGSQVHATTHSRKLLRSSYPSTQINLL